MAGDWVLLIDPQTGEQVESQNYVEIQELLGGGCERWLLELGTMLNLAVGVLGYDVSGERWDPVTLERWPLSAVRLDPYARKMWALTTTGEQEIVPGDGTWVVFAPGGLWNWDEALVRALAEPWVQEAMGMRDLGNRSAADAVAGLDLPLPSGVAPDSDESTKDDMRRLIEIPYSLG